MKRVLVTGPAGFVGANLVGRLLGDGHDVHAVVHPASDLWRLEQVAPDLTMYRVDLVDRHQVADAVARAGADWIVHAAAHGAYPSQTDLRRMIDTNLIGTVNLVEAGLRAGFEAFVHAGSSSEYGVKDHAPSPDELPEPNSGYAVTKAAATLYCRHAAHANDAPIRVLRLYSVYGPWEEPTRFMPRILTMALRGTWPPLANPATARDYVYTDDVMDAFLAALREPDQEPGAVYNIGTGTQTSLREVVEAVRHELAVPEEPRWGTMPDRIWDTGTWVAEPGTALKGLGWSARHDLSTGLRRFLSWLREQQGTAGRYEPHPG